MGFGAKRWDFFLGNGPGLPDFWGCPPPPGGLAPGWVGGGDPLPQFLNYLVKVLIYLFLVNPPFLPRDFVV